MKVDAIVHDALAQELFTVCEIGYHDGSTLSIRRWGTESGPLFDLASLTKLFTSTAICVLMEKQALSLFSDATSLVPSNLGYVRSRLGWAHVGNLLTHHSMLPAWHPFYAYDEHSFFEILQSSLKSEPMSMGYCYSDLNYMILAKIIEAVTDCTLQEALQTLVLDPMGLAETCYRPPDPERCVPTEWGNRLEKAMVSERGLSFGRWRDEGRAIQGEANDGNAFYYSGGVAGHAGLFSTSADLIKFAQAVNDDFLSPQMKQLVFRDWGSGRGLGWHQGELFPKGGWGHTGFTGTYLSVHPTDKQVLTILTNRLNVPNPRSIQDFRIAIAQACLE